MRKKIVEVLLLGISLLFFLGSHLVAELENHVDFFIFFGNRFTTNLIVDILILIALAIPMIVMSSLMMDMEVKD